MQSEVLHGMTKHMWHKQISSGDTVIPDILPDDGIMLPTSPGGALLLHLHTDKFIQVFLP